MSSIRKRQNGWSRLFIDTKGSYELCLPVRSPDTYRGRRELRCECGRGFDYQHSTSLKKGSAAGQRRTQTFFTQRPQRKCTQRTQKPGKSFASWCLCGKKTNRNLASHFQILLTTAFDYHHRPSVNRPWTNSRIHHSSSSFLIDH